MVVQYFTCVGVGVDVIFKLVIPPQLHSNLSRLIMFVSVFACCVCFLYIHIFVYLACGVTGVSHCYFLLIILSYQVPVSVNTVVGRKGVKRGNCVGVWPQTWQRSCTKIWKHVHKHVHDDAGEVVVLDPFSF